MLTAIVLIESDVASVPEVCEAIASLDGVSEVYSVTGDVDVVALVKVTHHEELAGVIADRIGKVPGVRETRTYIAFQSYSARDLEAAFAIGADE